ncbi:hypothetical protein ACQPXS_17315 [Streptomyces sp. CA-142005]
MVMDMGQDAVRHLVAAVAVGVLWCALLASDGDIDLPTVRR